MTGGSGQDLGRCAKCGGELEFAGDTGVCRRCAVSGAFETEGDDAQPHDLPREAAEPGPEARVGKYIRTQRLGAGGMGEVWKAWDVQLGRWVALKLLKGADREDIERLRREAHVAGTLNHPNIAVVHEVGEDAGRHFIAMQLIEGRTMRGWPRGDAAKTAQLVRDAARAVSCAHDRGIVHRDIKPDNLMVSTVAGTQRLYVTDFGLARSVSAPSDLSLTGAILGTPAYMSPEQAAGEPVDARTDVYGLGATLYELLTGRAPFEGRSPLDILVHVRQEEAPSPRAIDPSIDPDLETIVLKCLEKDRNRRYATAGELADDLDRFQRGDTIRARPDSLAYRLRKTVRRHRLPFGVAVLALVAIAAVASWPTARGVWGEWKGRRDLKARLERSRGVLERMEEDLASGEPQAAEARAREFELDVRAWVGRTGGPEESLWRSPEVRLCAREGHPFARIQLLRSRARESVGNRVAAEGSQLQAFDLGLSSADALEQRAAADALTRMIDSGNAGAGSRGAWLTVVRRFGRENAPLAAFRVAQASERAGDLEQALSEYAAFAELPGAPAAAVHEAREAMDVLAHLAHDCTLDVPEGRVALGIAGGPLPLRVASLTDDGRLRVFRLIPSTAGIAAEPLAETALRTDHNNPCWAHVWYCDVDGDGDEEIVVSFGPRRPEEAWGGIEIWDVRDGALVRQFSAPLRSWATCILAADPDRDGVRELFVGVSYDDRSLVVFHPSAADPGHALDEFRLKEGCDVEALCEVPLPGGRRGVLASFGPWQGWRFWLAEWDGAAGKFSESATSPWFAHAVSLTALPDGDILFSSSWSPDHRKVLARREPSGTILESGLYRMRFGTDPGIPVPEKWQDRGADTVLTGSGLARLGGRKFLVTSSFNRQGARGSFLEAVPLPGESGSIRPVSVRQEQWMRTLDADGDGDDEIFTSSTVGGRVLLRVYGWGSAVPHPIPEVRTNDFDGIQPGRLLLDVGLPARAAELCRGTDPVGLGLALMDLGDLPGAAEAFLSTSGAARTEALRHAAACLIRLRRWPQLEAVLKESGERPDLDPSERETVTKRMRWVSAAAAITVQARCERLAAAPAFVCENPLLVRQGPEDLEIVVPKGYQASAGIPLRYVGGPLKLAWSMRLSPQEFGVSSRVGLFGSHTLFLQCNLSGASAEPRQKQRVNGSAPSWPLFSSQEADDLFKPGDQWFDVEMEYLPELDSVSVVLTQGLARNEMVLNTPAKLAPGVYFFGAVGFPDTPLDAAPSVLRVRDIRVCSADAGTCFVPAPDDSPEDLLREANGEFARGRLDRATALYDALLERSGSLPPVFLKTCGFFRALALARAGHPEKAREFLTGLRAQDPECYRVLRLQALPGASPADAVLLPP